MGGDCGSGERQLYPYAGSWIPAYAGMTGLMARAGIATEGTPTAAYAGTWIPAYAGMTG